MLLSPDGHLVLGKSRDDVEVQLPACRCGVDSLCQRGEANFLLLMLGDQINPALAYSVPADQDAVPRRCRPHAEHGGRGQLRPCFRATAAVFLKDSAALCLFERVELHRHVLLVHRDSRVANDDKEATEWNTRVRWRDGGTQQKSFVPGNIRERLVRSL